MFFCICLSIWRVVKSNTGALWLLHSAISFFTSQEQKDLIDILIGQGTSKKLWIVSSLLFVLGSEKLKFSAFRKDGCLFLIWFCERPSCILNGGIWFSSLLNFFVALHTEWSSFDKLVINDSKLKFFKTYNVSLSCCASLIFLLIEFLVHLIQFDLWVRSQIGCL